MKCFNVKKLTIILLSFLVLFVGCKNSTTDITDGNFGYLKIKINEDNSRVIKPEPLNWNEIKEISLFSKRVGKNYTYKEVKTWTSTTEKTAHEIMLADEEILNSYGYFYFKVELKNANGNIVATGETKEIEVSRNEITPVSITTKTITVGQGAIDVFITWPEEISFTKITAGLYNFPDSTTVVTGCAMEALTVQPEVFSVEYKKENIPAGNYYFKYAVYDENNNVIKTGGDSVWINDNKTSSATFNITQVDAFRTITFVLGTDPKDTLKDDYILETLVSTIGKPTIPGVSDFKNEGDYVFAGWYANAEFNGGRIFKIEPGTEPVTLYAKFEKGKFIKYDNNFKTYLSGLTPSEEPYRIVFQAEGFKGGQDSDFSRELNAALKTNKNIKLKVDLNEASGWRVDFHMFDDCDHVVGITFGKRISDIACNDLDKMHLEEIVINPDNEKYDSRDNCNGIIETSSNTMLFASKNITIPSSVTTLASRLFEYRTDITEFTVPDNITELGDYLFKDCTELTKVVLPLALKKISDYAFSGCKKLKTVRFSGVQYLDDESTAAFPSDDGIVLLEEIGACAFHYCTALDDFPLPLHVKTIGDSAFYNCSSKANLKINSEVTSIGKNIVSGCTNLPKIIFDEENRTNWYKVEGTTETPIEDISTLLIGDFQRNVSYIRKTGTNE